MLGLSYGEVFLILGATIAVIGPKDIPRIAKAAGRLAGRAVGYVQSARGQMEDILQQTQANKVHKELQDTMAQLDAIRHEIRNISILNPSPLTRRLVEDSGLVPPSDNLVDKGSKTLHDTQRLVEGIHNKTETNSRNVPSSVQLQSQATSFAFIAESQGMKNKPFGATDALSSRQQETIEGLAKVDQTVVLPVSAESAGLLATYKAADLAGSDIVLEAILEADVARHAKEFFKQSEAQNVVSGSGMHVQK